MQYSSSGDRIGVEQGAGSQLEIASEALRRAQALLSRNETSRAAETLVSALDDQRLVELSLRAPLALLLARVLAAQGHLAAAVERLAPVLDCVEDHRSAAHIYCARAVELATQGKLSPALDTARKAEELAPSDDEVRAHVADLYTVVVPAFVLTSTAAVDDADVSRELMAEVLQRLILRFKSAPNNLQLAHVIALFAEWYATRADTQAIQTAIETAENSWNSQRPVQYDDGEFDAWHWTIRCWILLAYRTAYWQRWYRRLIELRGETEHNDVDLRAVADAALARIHRLHERLREFYRQPDSPLYNPERAERHQRYLVALATERKSAQVLSDLMGSASDRLRTCGFVGPIAGTGLLAAIGRLPAVQQFVQQQLSSASTGASETASAAVERLRQCLSPFSPMYTMHDLAGPMRQRYIVAASLSEMRSRGHTWDLSSASRRRRHSPEVISARRGSHALRHCVWRLRTIQHWNSLPK